MVMFSIHLIACIKSIRSLQVEQIVVLQLTVIIGKNKHSG